MSKSVVGHIKTTTTLHLCFMTRYVLLLNVFLFNIVMSARGIATNLQ